MQPRALAVGAGMWLATSGCASPMDPVPPPPDFVLSTARANLPPGALRALGASAARVQVRGGAGVRSEAETSWPLDVEVASASDAGLRRWSLSGVLRARRDGREVPEVVLGVRSQTGPPLDDVAARVADALIDAEIDLLWQGDDRPTVEAGPPEPAPAPVDVVFVIDRSLSMRDARTRLIDAGWALSVAEGFPLGTRFAVTEMIPLDPKDPSRPHPGTRRPGALVGRAAFGALVDRSHLGWVSTPVGSIQQGCDAWFAPEAVDSLGAPCLAVHAAASDEAGSVEAGLTAFYQLLALDRVGFRPGVDAHVVFVTDTEEPGVSARRLMKADEGFRRAVARLIADRPSPEEVLASALARGARSLTMHAVVPVGDCGESRAGLEPVYGPAASATGGELIDICPALRGKGSFVEPLVRALGR